MPTACSSARKRNKKCRARSSERALNRCFPEDEVSEQIIACVSNLARQHSADTITVRDVLKDLKITNRVFYNRFHNIDEVLEILYRDTVHKVRQSLALPRQDGTVFLNMCKQSLLRP